jgi:CRP/FNR family transcriptional regulator
MDLEKSYHIKLLGEAIKALKQSRFLGHLEEDVLSEMAKLATRRHFKKGDFIINEGDPPNFLYVIEKGRVKLFKSSSSGKNFTLHFAIRGNALNAMPLFEGKAHFLSAQAMDETTVLGIKRERWLSIVNKYPSVAMKILIIQTEVIKSAYERIIDLVGERVEQRLYNVLLTLNAEFGSSLLFTCEEIGELVGTTTETTIRILGKLKALGVIRSGRGEIVIADQKKLWNLSVTPYFI